MTLGVTAVHTARLASLDACYGTNKAPNMPSSFNLRMYSADPVSGGAELGAAGGYTALSVANSGTNFGAATVVGGVATKANAVALSMAASTGAWSAGATHWALESGGVIYDTGPITDPTTGNPMTLTVSQANVTVRFGIGKLTITVPTP